MIALVALAGGLGVVAGLTSTALAKPQPALTQNDVSVSAWPANQGSLSPGQDLVVQVAVRNGSSAAIAAPTASLWINRAPVSSVPDLVGWLHPESTSDADRLGSLLVEQAVEPIAPGASASFTLAVPAASMGLATSTKGWGARQLAVRVSAGGAELAQARSALVWNAVPAFTPVKLALAMPLTVPTAPEGLIPAGELASYTGSGGLLTRQLDAAIERSVAIGIDPMILASIRILGSDAPPTATAWLDRLASAPNETFALAYADADVTLATQAGFPSIPAPEGFDFAIDPARFEAAAPVVPSATDGSTPGGSPTPDAAPGPTTSPEPSPSPTVPPGEPVLPTTEDLLAWPYTLTGMAWPAENSVVAGDLPALATAGVTTTILTDANVSRETSSTPNAASGIGGQSALVADSAISGLLRSAAGATTAAEWNNALPALSAALATIARERASTPTVLLATFDRGWPGFASHRAETIDALSTLPWAASAPLSEAVSTPGSGGSLVDHPRQADRLLRAQEMLAALDAEAQFATVVENPVTITAERRVEFLGRMSVGWQDELEAWFEETTAFLTDSTSLRSSVQIVESSTINLLADRGALPITVSNALGEPVTVFVTVRPLKALLAVQDPRVKVTIDPDSQRKGLVSVQSISNGEVRLEVILTSSTGARIGETTFVDINVQAGWETIGTVIAAALVVLVFGLGLIRNITKRRRDRAFAAVSAADLDKADHGE